MEFRPAEQGTDRVGSSRSQGRNRERGDDSDESSESHDTQTDDAQTARSLTSTPDTATKYAQALEILAENQRRHAEAVSQGRDDAPVLGQKAHTSRRLVDLMERDMKRKTIHDGLDVFSLNMYETAITNTGNPSPAQDAAYTAAKNRCTALKAMAVDLLETERTTQLGTAQTPDQAHVRERRQRLMDRDRNACNAILQCQGNANRSEATLTDAQRRELRSAIMAAERDTFDISTRYENSRYNARMVRAAMSETPSNELPKGRILGDTSFVDMWYTMDKRPGADSRLNRTMNGELAILPNILSDIPQFIPGQLSL